VTETSASAHTLGTGYEVGSGSWSQNGEATYATHSSTTIAVPYTAPRRVSNQVNTRRFDTNCTVNSDGTITHRAVRASGGFHAPYISMSAQASFSSNTEIQWTTSTKEWLCPSNYLGLVDAPSMGAKHYVPPCTTKPCPTIETN
jgi:hypothetical protein